MCVNIYVCVCVHGFVCMGVLGVGVGAPPTFPSRHVGVRACILVFNMLMCFCKWGALGVGVGAPPAFPSRYVGVRACVLVF